MARRLLKIVREEDVRKSGARLSLKVLISEHAARMLIEDIADEVESYVNPEELARAVGIRLPRAGKQLEIEPGDELLIIAPEGPYQAFAD